MKAIENSSLLLENENTGQGLINILNSPCTGAEEENV